MIRILQNRREEYAHQSNHELNVGAGIGVGQKTKKARNSAPRNRYYVGAKLSEHKFLRLLRGFAEGKPINVLEPSTHVSDKTIRATYGALRAHLPIAISKHPESFSGAGLVLIHPEAPALFHAARHSPIFRRHRRHHAPRLKCPDEEMEHIHETAVRLLCALDLREVGLHKDEHAVRDILLRLADTVPRLSPREPLQKLAAFIPGAKPFAHPELKFYEDYRRCLLKNPLGTQ